GNIAPRPVHDRQRLHHGRRGREVLVRRRRRLERVLPGPLEVHGVRKDEARLGGEPGRFDDVRDAVVGLQLGRPLVTYRGARDSLGPRQWAWSAGSATASYPPLVDALGHPVDGRAVARANAKVHEHGIVDPTADATQHEAMRCGHVARAFDDRGGDAMRGDVVELSDVGHGILAGGRFERHRAVGRYEAVDAVAPAYLTVVSGLGRRAGHREIRATGGPLVGRVAIHR